MSGVSERDADAISRAIRILSEAGYRVERVGEAEEGNNGGVDFTLDVEAPSRSRWFEPQSEDVRAAAIDADEYDMGGNRVEDDG